MKIKFAHAQNLYLRFIYIFFLFYIFDSGVGCKLKVDKGKKTQL